MDRRKFLALTAAAAVAPLVPVQSQPNIVGIDFAAGPDETVYRLLSVKNGLARELHRVTGIPRYQMGPDGERDTWQEQVDAGKSELII